MGAASSGFGTGLGKTTTALALEAFNYENGRSTRTAYVVPKSVLENWYYEAKEFLSEEAFSNYLFVGLDVLMDGDQIRQCRCSMRTVNLSLVQMALPLCAMPLSWQMKPLSRRG